MRKHALIVTLPPEYFKPKTKKLFKICSRRLCESVDGVNSSLAQSASESWRCKRFQKWKKVANARLKGLSHGRQNFDA